MDPISIDIDAIQSKAQKENFPVAFRFLPQKYRHQLNAFYNFARLVDDLGDEYEGDRLLALNWATDQLQNPTHQIFVDLLLSSYANWNEADKENFAKLISANRQDQEKHRYETHQELDEYCELSANPVGRIVLSIFGIDSPDLVQQSDLVCSGLQILEHLQDVGEDYKMGRIYLPQSDLKLFDVTESQLDVNKGNLSASSELRSLVLHNLKRVEEMLSAGDLLVASISGWGKWAIGGYVAGGKVAANTLKAAGGDIFSKRAQKRNPITTALGRAYYLLRLISHRSKV